MESELISLECAKLAEDKKCDLNLFGNGWTYKKDGIVYWTNNPDADPEQIREIRCTQSLLQRWLREKHNINIDIEIGWDNGCFVYDFIVWEGFKDHWENASFSTYEKALEVGLIEGLKLINL